MYKSVTLVKFETYLYPPVFRKYNKPRKTKWMDGSNLGSMFSNKPLELPGQIAQS